MGDLVATEIARVLRAEAQQLRGLAAIARSDRDRDALLMQATLREQQASRLTTDDEEELTFADMLSSVTEPCVEVQIPVGLPG